MLFKVTLAAALLLPVLADSCSPAWGQCGGYVPAILQCFAAIAFVFFTNCLDSCIQPGKDGPAPLAAGPTTTTKAATTTKASTTTTNTKAPTTVATTTTKTTTIPAPTATGSCAINAYDATAIANAKNSCSTITVGSFTVPGGETLDFTGLKKGTTLNLRGTITFGYKEWGGPLMSISGDSINVDGTGSLLNAQGEKYWDGLGGNGGKTKPRTLFLKSISNSHLKNIKILNPPVNTISLHATNTIVEGFIIDASAGDTGGGHNTDAFDIGSNGLILRNCWVHNQDDCTAINSGYNITVSGLTCIGGHGLSIGSVNSDTLVNLVTFSDSIVQKSANGVRIKTKAAATNGGVTNVTYKNIKVQDITGYGIVVQQDYGNTGHPGTGMPITVSLWISAVPGFFLLHFDTISQPPLNTTQNLVMQNITGNVVSGKTPVRIECGSGACSNWNWSKISISGGKNSCNYTPNGFTC
uniref:endo-polygalacturonase n=1 Tax=Rhizophlyctis rosea TaxID=64517 RepID=A0A2U8U9W8_9FUNG|nr:glycoside hydrolase family 28 [Rhizophlyctis rosea]